MAAVTARADRWPSAAGLAVATAGAALGAATLVLVVIDLDSSPSWTLPGLTQEWTYGLRLAVGFLSLFTLAIVAGLIVRRQPRSAFTWAFTSVALLNAVQWAAAQYAIHGLLVAPGSLPLAAAAARLQLVIVGPIVALYIIAILLFPNGRLLSARWAVAVAAVVVAQTLDTLVRLDAPYPIALGLGGLQTVPVTGAPELWSVGAAFAWSVRWVYWGLFPIFAAVSVAVILRLRASSGDTRLQLKWFTYATAIAVIAATLGRIDGVPFVARTFGDIAQAIAQWSLLGQDVVTGIVVPATIGVAILRYRLYDIDVVINRTIVYGGLAAFVTLTYALAVAAVGAALGETVGLGPVATILSIALIAALLEPVRGRLHALANVAVYGRRANPYEVLSAFAQSVGAAARADVLLPRMAALAREATRAARIEIWIRVGEQLQLASASPEVAGPRSVLPRSEDLAERAGDAGNVIPVYLDTQHLGALLVWKARGVQLSATERRLLGDLASQAGLVFSRFRLVEELRESRARIVAAQDEERRRIERDLHDGAQQRFVNAMLAVGMAQAVDGGATASADLLEQAAREMKAGLSELRALARGVHPPLLTDEGLPAAIASLADRSPILTKVTIHADRRYAEAVEATAYFVVAEALANAAKHSHAANLAIRIDEADGRLRVEIADDGVGGADPRGSGLVGLRDRATAIGGSLAVDSDAHGTVVRADLPCA